MDSDLALVALLVLGYSLVSRRLSGSPVTPPMLFVAFGLVLGPEALGWVELDLESSVIELLTEATLALVLFADASRIDLRRLRHEFHLPARLLAIGMPLTVAAGTGLALLLFDDLSFGEAALVGAILAPTDAALGQAVVSSPAVPVRVRQSLNVESGLNDGIALPIVTVFLAVAAVESEVGSASFWTAFAAKQIGFGVLVGVVVGCLGAIALDQTSIRGWVDGRSKQIATFAVAAAAFGVSTSIDGNGFLAAFVSGMAFGSITRDRCDAVIDFIEEEGELLTLVTFLVFGAVIAGPALDDLDWRIAVYAVASLTLVRLVPVALSMLGAGTQPLTVLFLGWFGPRGLASILFGLVVLEEAEIVHREQVFLVVTWTVLLSVAAHGLSASPAARRYGAAFDAMADDHDDMPEAVEVTDLPTRRTM